jgi:hypothetical protein
MCGDLEDREVLEHIHRWPPDNTQHWVVRQCIGNTDKTDGQNRGASPHLYPRYKSYFSSFSKLHRLVPRFPAPPCSSLVHTMAACLLHLPLLLSTPWPLECSTSLFFCEHHHSGAKHTSISMALSICMSGLVFGKKERKEMDLPKLQQLAKSRRSSISTVEEVRLPSWLLN